MAQNLREQVLANIQTILKEMDDPSIVLVTREPFNVVELAITQFPAVLITARTEDRETITMGAPGAGRRMGTINIELRGFVRGNELDRKRNDLIERIEEALESDRYRGLQAQGVIDSQIVSIEITDRMPPLAEIAITFRVRYNYLRATT
jgi:hypothetical protein